MPNVNRHLRGNTSDILQPVRGVIVVEQGDLMYRNENVSNYAFPLDECKDSTAGTAYENTIYTNFIGVAMEASPAGVTENITIATEGVFRYPIVAEVSAVTVGSLVSAVSPASSGGGGSPQHVANNATQSAWGTTAYFGHCVKTESGASFIDFEIKTLTGKGLAS